MFFEARQDQARGILQPLLCFRPGQMPGHLATEVAEEHFGEPAQGTERIGAAARTATRAGHHRVGIFLQRRHGKGFEQGGLAAARIAADKRDCRLAGQGGIQAAAEAVQLILPRDEPDGGCVTSNE